VNTNHIKDELVRVTALASHLKGFEDGRAAEKANPS
jgi:hypothetical protein